MKHFSLSLLLFVSTSLFALPSSFHSLAVEKMASTRSDAGGFYSNTIELSWSPISGANAYVLVITENGSVVMQNTVYGTTKTITGLIPGHTYRYTVTPISNGSQNADYIICNDILP